jgi:hypothetical protein
MRFGGANDFKRVPRNETSLRAAHSAALPRFSEHRVQRPFWHPNPVKQNLDVSQ